MALDERQMLLYTDTCNIYKPVNLMDSASIMPNHDVKSLRYPASPTYTAIKWFHRTRDKLGKGKFSGRETQETTTANTDNGAFDQAQDINTNYVLVKTTPGDPDINVWFIVEANPDVNNYRANKRRMFLKRITKPTGVT